MKSSPRHPPRAKAFFRVHARTGNKRHARPRRLEFASSAFDFGMVLGKGGALAKLLLPFRLGAGGRLGSGQQWMSWIHIDDVVSLIRFAIENAVLQGPINATAPYPVTNDEFTRRLAAALHRPAIFPVPVFALKLVFGEMSEVLLDSQRVLPAAAQSAGFHFQYPGLEAAFGNLLNPAISYAPRT